MRSKLFALEGWVGSLSWVGIRAYDASCDNPVDNVVEDSASSLVGCGGGTPEGLEWNQLVHDIAIRYELTCCKCGN